MKRIKFGPPVFLLAIVIASPAMVVVEAAEWSMPALSDGLIYARNAAGDLVCVNVGK